MNARVLLDHHDHAVVINVADIPTPDLSNCELVK